MEVELDVDDCFVCFPVVNVKSQLNWGVLHRHVTGHEPLDLALALALAQHAFKLAVSNLLYARFDGWLSRPDQNLLRSLHQNLSVWRAELGGCESNYPDFDPVLDRKHAHVFPGVQKGAWQALRKYKGKG